MVRRRGLDELVRRQRAAAERLRREVFGIDGSLRNPYFRDLRRQLRGFRSVVERAKVLDACARADVIYVGDFHANPACQLFAADLLDDLASRGLPLALGIEFLYTRQQPLLESRQAGRLSDPVFLRRVHYREEWGYPWEGFAALLDRARARRVPVYALDAAPRGGFDGLARRDEHAARRICSILDDNPRPRVVVLFGESHVSSGHIPRRVESHWRRRSRRLRQVTVFQDPDGLYWSLLSERGAIPEAVRLDSTSFAVFGTSPLAKYESYRQVLERWRGDVPPEEEVDLTPAVHHLIHVLLAWLGIRPERYRLKHRAGWAEELVDALPEVYSGPEAYDLLIPILEDHGRTRAEVEEATLLLRDREALFEPRSNTLFLLRYLPGRAAAEGARFLRAALCGRLFHAADEGEDTDPGERMYGAAYNEALAFLGARLVDPGSGNTRSGLEEGDSLSPSLRNALALWMEGHDAFERSRRATPPRGLLEPVRSSRPLRRAAARRLGVRVGRVLFDDVRSGRWSRPSLRSLFTRALDGPRARRVVLQLLRSPGRG